MFEDISKEQLSKYKRRAGFVGRMVKIYLPLWLFSLYIYFYPVGASQDTYFQFDVSRNYIILGVVLTLLIYYSLQRTVTVFDKDLTEKFLNSQQQINSYWDRVKFLFRQKEKLLELGIFTFFYLIIPRVATSPSMQFLILGSKAQYADKVFNDFLNVGGKADFLTELYITLIVLPIMLVIFVLANASAIGYWNTRERAKSMDKKNLGPNEQKKLEKQDRKSSKRSYITLLLAYFVGATGLTVLFPVVFNGISPVVLFVIIRIITVVATVFAILLVWRFTRAIIIRRKFTKRLKRLCKERKMRITKIRYPFRSLFTLYNGEDFRISFNGKSYSCKLLCSLKKGNPLFLYKGGMAARVVNIMFLRFRIFSYTKSFKFGWDADCKKLIIINPTPLQILLAGGTRPAELDNGDIIDGYEIYTGTAFLNALERDVIDID